MRQSLNCLGIEYVQFQRFAQKRTGDELVAQSPQEQLECADRVEYETGENGSQNIRILALLYVNAAAKHKKGERNER